MEFFVGRKPGEVRLTVMSDEEMMSENVFSPVTKDIYEEDLGFLCDCLDKIIKIRIKPFDSSELIESLFDKLTEEQASNLSAILYERHFQTQI